MTGQRAQPGLVDELGTPFAWNRVDAVVRTRKRAAERDRTRDRMPLYGAAKDRIPKRARRRETFESVLRDCDSIARTIPERCGLAFDQGTHLRFQRAASRELRARARVAREH